MAGEVTNMWQHHQCPHSGVLISYLPVGGNYITADCMVGSLEASGNPDLDPDMQVHLDDVDIGSWLEFLDGIEYKQRLALNLFLVWEGYEGMLVPEPVTNPFYKAPVAYVEGRVTPVTRAGAATYT